MASVDFVRRELEAMLSKYQKIDDACDGQEAVKLAATKYLPAPKADGVNTPAYKERYDDYLLRAQYINFSGRTVEGLTGLIFSKPVTAELPTLCKIIEKNADGSGVSLAQSAKNASQHVMKKGRCGLFVDYPTRATAATRAELEAGDVRPVILIYNPANIINWDTALKGSKVYYTMIVLKEQYSERTAGDFEVKVKDQYRVLELVDANNVRYSETIGPGARYCQTIWRKTDATAQATTVATVDPKEPNLGQLNQAGYSAGARSFVKDGKGEFLSEIPFSFIGATSNDSSIDKPPILDIVNVNLGHYINSADYEDSCFLVGQPTPVVAGITDVWWKEILKERLTLGSRSTISLPVGGTLALVQASPNSMVKEAMALKEAQMVKLGAKLIEEGKVSKTATEDTNDNIAENSVLGNIASNVEAAFKYALEWCAIFTGELTQNADAKDNSIKFVLNKKFNTQGATAAERAQLLKEWMADAISKTEYRRNLRQSGIELDNDDTAETEIVREQQLQIEFETERNKQLAAAGAGNLPGNNNTNPNKLSA